MNIRSLPFRISFLAILIQLLFAPILYSAEPMWTTEFKKDVKWLQLTPTGHLIAGTDEGLVALDPTTGSIMWKDEELKGMKQANFNIIPLTQYAVINKGKGFLGAHNKMIVIDYVKGGEKWNSDILDILSSLGQYIVPSKKALFVHGRNTKGKEWPRLVNLDDGSLIWENKDFFKKRKPKLFKLSGTKVTLLGNQDPIFDTDETMITCMNGKSVCKWDLNTGQLIWETKLKKLKKYPPALSYGYSPILMNNDNSVIYIPAVKSLYAVRTSDGSLVWGEKPAKLNGMPYQLWLGGEGLLVKGGPNSEGKDGKNYMMMLDPATGRHKWDKKFDKLKESTGFAVKDGSAFVYSNKKIYKIDLASGKYEEFSKDVKFDGKEIPSSIIVTENGFSMVTSQNVMMIGFDGSHKFHTYHKAPGGSLFGKIASTALITAVNVGSAMSAQARAQASASRSVSGKGSASYSLITSNPYLSKRFQATKNSETYTYILGNLKTDSEKGPGIAKVNKLTGETENMIILKDKKPLYEVDDVESTLFYVDDKKKIVCYAL